MRLYPSTARGQITVSVSAGVVAVLPMALVPDTLAWASFWWLVGVIVALCTWCAVGIITEQRRWRRHVAELKRAMVESGPVTVLRDADASVRALDALREGLLGDRR